MTSIIESRHRTSVVELINKRTWEHERATLVVHLHARYEPFYYAFWRLRVHWFDWSCRGGRSWKESPLGVSDIVFQAIFF